MTTQANSWKETKAKGDKGEVEVKRLLESFSHREASMDEQFKGIDFVFNNDSTGDFNQEISVEVKTDYAGHDSGNIFYETVCKNVITGIEVPGWAYKTDSDYTFIIIPDRGTRDYKLLIISTPEMMANRDYILREFEKKGPVKDGVHETMGIIIPIDRLKSAPWCLYFDSTNEGYEEEIIKWMYSLMVPF